MSDNHNQACTLMFFAALRAKPQLNPDAGQKMQRNCADEPHGKMFAQLTRKARLPAQRHLVLQWRAGYLDATKKAWSGLLSLRRRDKLNRGQ